MKEKNGKHNISFLFVYKHLLIYRVHTFDSQLIDRAVTPLSWGDNYPSAEIRRGAGSLYNPTTRENSRAIGSNS